MTSNFNSQYGTYSPLTIGSYAQNHIDKTDPIIGQIVCRTYKIIYKIDEGNKKISKQYQLPPPIGSFGKIYCAVHQLKQDRYAVKIMKQQNKIGETLLIEAQILLALKGEKGFPRLYYYIWDQNNHNIIIETLLGMDLYKLFQLCNRKFSLRTVLQLFDQILNRLEFLHKNQVFIHILNNTYTKIQYIHRDIKPENLLIGLGQDKQTIHLIDFGLSLKYIDKNGKHIKQQHGQPLVGTARFTPQCSHQGLTQSRKSDLESLGYVMIYFLKGTLPWMNIQADTIQDRYYLIGQKKINTSAQNLWQNTSLNFFIQISHDLPEQFITYFNYIFNLNYDQEPSYSYLRKIFKTLYLQYYHERDCNFDWDFLQNTTQIPQSSKFANNLQQQLKKHSQKLPQKQESIQELHSCSSSQNYKNMKSPAQDLLRRSKSSISLQNFEEPQDNLEQRLNKSKGYNEQNLGIQNIMLNRQSQQNSILSKNSYIDSDENLEISEIDEYFPYKTLNQLMDKLNSCIKYEFK